MRLIDADAMVKEIEKAAEKLHEKRQGRGNGKTVAYGYLRALSDIREMIIGKPTAYDLDGVLNRLEEELSLADEEKGRCTRQNFLQFESAKGYANGIANAIDYVKAGVMPGEKARENQWISVREKLPECGIPVVVLLQGQHPEDVVYEVAELVDLSVDTKIQGKYWYKKGCGYLQHPAYVDGCGCFPGYEVVAWLPLPGKYEREEEQDHETD